MKYTFKPTDDDENDDNPIAGWVVIDDDPRWKKDGTNLRMCLRYNACCGLFELNDFRFPFGTPEGDFTAFFENFVRSIGEEESKGILHLTLNRWVSKRAAINQPKWFVDAVTAYPGAIHSEWVYNPNSGNYIQMWMLPTHREKRT